MKIMLPLLSAIIMLLTYAPLTALVSYHLIKGPKGKLILILGDVHTDNSTVTVVTEVLKKIPLKKPLPLLVELQEVAPREHICIESVSVKALYALQESFKKGTAPLDIFRCEPRGNMSDLLEVFRKRLNEFCHQLVTEDEFLHHADSLSSGQKISPPELSNKKKKAWNRKKDELLRNTPIFEQFEGPAFTVQAYKKYLDTQLAFLRKCRDTQKKKAWHTVLQSMVENYAQTIGEIKTRLAAGNEHDSLLKRFKVGLKGCTSSTDLLEWAESWSNLYLKRADYGILDVAMIARIADFSEDEAPLCLVVGEAHANMIAQALTNDALDYQILKESSCWCEVSFAVRTDCEPGSVKMKEFTEELKQVMSELLEPLKVPVRVCGSCEQSFEKMVRCGQCKQVLYCNAECQKKDWASHKLSCQKVKVRI